MSPASNNINLILYRKSSQGLNRPLELDEETSRIFNLLDESIQLSKVAEQAGVSLAVLWKAIAKLSRMGLIENVDDGGGFVGQQFVDTIQKELAKAVGPISTILLNKMSSQMGITLPDIPVDRSRELINFLADKIPDETARAEFKRILHNDI